MIRIIATGLSALLLTSSLASAQGEDMKKKMRIKMEEISELMRESERLLLEITRVDRLVSRQQEIVRKLKDLEPPKSNDPAAAAAHQAKQEELRNQQRAAVERLGRLFDNQRLRGQSAVLQLAQLLKNWPKSRQQVQGQPDKSQRQRDQAKRLRDKQREQKQRSQQQGRRNQKNRDKPSGMKRPKDQKQAARAIRQIEAWITRLPAKQQERISRGDLSDIPARYRRLVREYTALLAKREAERTTEDE